MPKLNAKAKANAARMHATVTGKAGSKAAGALKDKLQKAGYLGKAMKK